MVCCVQGYTAFRECSGRVLDLRPRGRGFEPQIRHCLVSLSKTYNPSLVLVQSKETRPYITEKLVMGGISKVQWLSGRVLDSRPRGRGFEPQSRHCVVSLSKTYNPSLVLVQSRETRPYITEKLVMGGKESNQTNKYTAFYSSNRGFAVTTNVHTFIIIKDTIVKLLSLKRRRISVFTFNYFQQKHMATYIVGTQKTRLNETCLLSTQNIMAL